MPRLLDQTLNPKPLDPKPFLDPQGHCGWEGVVGFKLETFELPRTRRAGGTAASGLLPLEPGILKNIPLIAKTLNPNFWHRASAALSGRGCFWAWGFG